MSCHFVYPVRPLFRCGFMLVLFSALPLMAQSGLLGQETIVAADAKKAAVCKHKVAQSRTEREPPVKRDVGKPKVDLSQLFKGLDDPDPVVQESSLESLFSMYSPDVQEVLIRRGLDYSATGARKIALRELEDRLPICDETGERHLSLLRDAFNDPDS